MTYSVTVSGTTFSVDMTAVSFPVTLSQVGQQGTTGASWQGAWATPIDYAANDVVSNGGSAYICILAHTSAAADEPGVGVNTATYWATLAQGGADGTGFTGGSYNAGTGVVTFTSDDGLGFSTGDLRGAAGADGTGFTGGSYNVSTGVVTFTSDDGLGFATGDLRGAAGADGTGWTGGSYDAATGVVTFTSDDGLGFSTGDLRGADGAGSGTVTSIDITGGTGITSTGGPVTSSGAITVALDSATQTSLGKADTALQPAAIGTTVQGYSAVLAATTASYTTAEETKLDGIETGATADQTGAEIKAAYEGEEDTNAYTDAEKSKLAGIEAGADVTDTANVTAAGALMDSEVTNLAAVKAFDPADYATAAQGSTADTAVQPGDNADTLGSGAATDGHVLTADGAGGAAWEAAAGGGGLDFIASADAASAATVEFTAFDATKYDAYLFVLSNLASSTIESILEMRTSSDGGSTYDISGYSPLTFVTNSSGINGIYAYASAMPIAHPVPTASKGGYSGEVKLYGPHLAQYTRMTHSGLTVGADFLVRYCRGVAERQSTAEVNAVQFKIDGGVIASGTITMYGMKNA